MTHFVCSFDRASGRLQSDVVPFAAPVQLEVFVRGEPGHAGHRGAPAVAAAQTRAGDAFASQLDGAFAAVMHQKAQSRLVAAADDVGTTPLFHAERDRTLFLSSSLTRLIRILRPDEFDETYLLEYLLEGWSLGSRTPFRDVARLLPGDVLTVISGSVSILTDWSLAKLPEAELRTPEDAIAGFQEVFRASIRTALPAAGPVWAELSGGLDSSSVLLGAHEAAPGRVEAVSVIYPTSPQSDEQRWIRPVIDRARVPWHVIDGDESCSYNMLPDRFHAEPSLMLLSPGNQARLRPMLTEASAAVLLTGHGGDAVLFGDGIYPYHIADRLSRLDVRGAYREAALYEAAALRPRGAAHWLVHFGLKPLWRHWRDVPLDYDGKRAPWLAADALTRATNLLPDKTPEKRAGVSRVSTAWFLHRLRRTSRFVALGDQHALPCGVRHPLLSRNLVAFMLSLPDRFKTHPGMDRSLQRHALRALLPQEILLRRSKGGPDQAHFKALGRSRDWQRLLLEDSVLVQRGLVNKDRWRATVTSAAGGAVTDLRRFQATASLDVWFKQLHRLVSEPMPDLNVYSSSFAQL